MRFATRPVLRLVFPNDARSRDALTRLRLENLDSGILGEEFPESAIHVSAVADHFALMSAERVLLQVDELVADQQAASALLRTSRAREANS
jgi:hypothetical protein